MNNLLSKFNTLRIEIGILLFSLLCTFLAKYHLLASFKPEQYHKTLFQITIPDLLFILSAILFISILYAIKPSRWSVRIAIISSSTIAGWSILNYVWLIKCGAQLQPGILLLFVKDFTELLPIVVNHISSGGFKFVSFLILGMTLTFFLCWKVFRPRVIEVPQRFLMRIVVICLSILVVFAFSFSDKSQAAQSLSIESLNFSSHWFAISSVFSNIGLDRDIPAAASIPKSGRRQVLPPKDFDKPNIVIVLLESVSSSVAELDNPSESPMKNLAALAQKGALINSTYAPVSHTTKSIWTTLTSTTPIIDADYLEAVPVEEPYETLPTILSRHGYKSAFFKMAKGSFECAPGMMKNMGFDHAWFRENKADKSTHLGYMCGDDCQMIPNAVQWASENKDPFLLTLLTSVTHDPFDVPATFEEPAKEPYQRYLQTVRYSDKFIADLYAALKEKSLTENLLLCVIGDHGTSFRENNITSRWHPYQEVVNVPWVIHWPDRLSPQKITASASQLDVTPTLLSLMGFDISNANFEGIDAIAPNPTQSQRRFYFSSWYGNSPMGFVQDNRKYIYYPSTQKVFAFDLYADPGETKPISVNSAVAEKIQNQLLAWQHFSRRISIDEETETEQLLYGNWLITSDGSEAKASYIPAEEIKRITAVTNR